MTDLPSSLEAAGVPSEAAGDAAEVVAIEAIERDQRPIYPQEYRAAIAHDAPAILRVLLEARMKEMTDMEWYELEEAVVRYRFRLMEGEAEEVARSEAISILSSLGKEG